MANNILDLIQGLLTPEVIAAISKQTGATPQQTETVADAGLHSILGGLANNAATPEGASGILAALDKDHDGSILNDILGMVTGAAQPQNPSAVNGAGILQHVLGGNLGSVAGAIAQMSGLNAGVVMAILSKIAPLVMGTLGGVKQQQGMDAGGLGSILGAVLHQSPHAQDESSPIGSILSQVLGGGGGIGSILGTLLGGGGSAGGGLGNILGAVLGGGGNAGGGGLGNILGAVLGGGAQNNSNAGGGLGSILGAVLGGGAQNNSNAGGGLGSILGAVLGGAKPEAPKPDPKDELLNEGMKILGGLFGKK
jgi:hypothetical protein